MLTDLLLIGSLLKINKTLIEFHDWMASNPERQEHSKNLRESLNTMAKVSNKFELLQLDDETFRTSNFDLPKC